MLRDSYSIHKCNDWSYHEVATSKSRDLSFLVGFGHSGLLFEGLDFSDYRTNASELEMAHLAIDAQ